MNDERNKSLGETIFSGQSTIVEQVLDANRSEKQRCFIVLSGLDAGNIIKLDETSLIIGRGAECGVVLRDDDISRRHAKVQHSDQERLVIQDMNSTNGTFVNGKKISATILREGYKVVLGCRTVLKYVLLDEMDKSYQEKIYESSTRDGLTMIYNRKYFASNLIGDLSFAKRHSIPLTLFMMDIDHFKKVNDAYGHSTGDYVLTSLAKFISDTIRASDVLARYGGEEFAIIAKGIGIKGGTKLAERIRLGISKKKMISVDGSDAEFRITLSIGVATLPPGVDATPQTLVKIADKNLYAAKQRGRNRTVSSEVE